MNNIYYINYTHLNNMPISSSQHFNDLNFYSQYMLGLVIIYGLLLLIFKFLDNSNKRNNNRSYSFDFYGRNENLQIIHDELTPEQSSLRKKYLIAITIIKSAFWVKSPYQYALYSRLHGFSREEIAYLLILENFISIIFGPIIGSLGDAYGKKKFSAAYCFLIIMNLSFRLTGDRQLAPIAQVLAGISSIIIDVSFESWVNFQANELFPSTKEGKRQKNSYLREVFTKQIYIDSLCAMLFTGIATVIYDIYGIRSPFYLTIILCLIGGVYIVIVWEENKTKEEKIKNLKDNQKDFKKKVNLIEESPSENKSFFQKIQYSWLLLKSNIPLFSIGIIESTYKISVSLWIYLWTPLLEETSNMIINVGVIYLCFMFAKLIGCELYDGLKKILQSNTYLITLFLTLTACISFYIEFSYINFHFRLISLIYFDGTIGAFQPLMSSLKSQMIPEGNRSTIMTFFKLPINICNVLILFFSTYLTISQVCLIGFIVLLVSSFVSVILLSSHTPPDADIRVLLTTSEILKNSFLERKYFKDSVLDEDLKSFKSKNTKNSLEFL